MQTYTSEVRCPITGKSTASCGQCLLFKSKLGEGSPKCTAVKGQKYQMVARPESGDFWDTYVLTPAEIKSAKASHGISYTTIKAKDGAS